MNKRIPSIILTTLTLLTILTPLTTLLIPAQAGVAITKVWTTNGPAKFYDNQKFYVYVELNTTATINFSINNTSAGSVNASKASLEIIYDGTTLLANGTAILTNLSIGDVIAVTIKADGATAGPLYFTYTPTAGQLTIDRSEYPAFNESVIHLVLDDWDKNLDPYATDTPNVTITAYAHFLNGTSKSGNLTIQFTEAGTNTSEFVASITLRDVADALSITLTPTVLADISCFELVYNDAEANTTSSQIFSVFYTIGTINVATPSFPDELYISISDEDSNLDGSARDTLTHSQVIVEVVYIDPNTGTTYIIDRENITASFIETDVGTGVFEATIPVTFNATIEPPPDIANRAWSYDSGSLFIVPGSKIEVYYYDFDPEVLGLRLITVKEIEPEFYNTTLELTYNGQTYTSDFTAPTPVNFKFNLSFADMNIEDNQWNITKDGPCPQCLCYDYKLTVGSPAIVPVVSNWGNPVNRTVGELIIKVDGTVANMTENITVSICRLATGYFKVEFKDKYLRKVPFNAWEWLSPRPHFGGNLTVEWVDYVAGKTASITATFPEAVVNITLDRTEYPVLHSSEPGSHNVTVHIYVYDTSSIGAGTVTVNVTVYSSAPEVCNISVLFTDNVTLHETSTPGYFEGTETITVDERYINATLVATYIAGDGTQVQAKAKFVPHNAELEICNDTASVGDTIIVRLKEPDRNLDSQAYDTVDVTLYVYSDEIGTIRTIPLTLNETEPNSGVFEASLTLDDKVVYWVDTTRTPYVIRIADGIKVEYVDGLTTAARWVTGAVICPPCVPTCSVEATPEYLSDTLTITKHKAEMWKVHVDPEAGNIYYQEPSVKTESVLPVDRIKIYVYDPDLLYVGLWMNKTYLKNELGFSDTAADIAKQAAYNTLTISAKAEKDKEEKFLLLPISGNGTINDTFVTDIIDVLPIGCCEIATRACTIDVYGPGDKILVKFIDYEAPEGVVPIQNVLDVIAYNPAFEITITNSTGAVKYSIKLKPEDAIVEDGKLVYKISEPVLVEVGDYLSVKVYDADTLALYDASEYDKLYGTLGLKDPYAGYTPYIGINTKTDPTGISYAAPAIIVTSGGMRYFEVKNVKLDNSTILFKSTDTLYIRFFDFANNASATPCFPAEVVVEIPVGKLVKYPLEPETNATLYKFIDLSTGEEITKITSNVLVGVEIPVTNVDTVSHEVTAIVQIEKNGMVMRITLSTFIIPAGTTKNIIVSLGGYLEPGEYTVKVFLWESLATMKPLSDKVIEFSITVEE